MSERLTIRDDPLTQPEASEGPPRFRELNEIGRKATLRGDYREALRVYDMAHQLAVALDDERMSGVARLNRAMVLIKMGQARRGEEGLRELLLRTSDPKVAFSAAYNLASSLRKQGLHERAMRYARRAMDQARQLGVEELAASTHNLIGNILLSQSYVDEALQEYGRSRERRRVLPGDHRFAMAILEENIGYCLLLKERFDEGIETIRGALSLAEEVGDRRCRAECLQDLCYAHLLRDDFDRAREFGRRALAAAVDSGYRDVEENCHYLLGELGSRTGDLDLRDEHFERLQAQHPELPFLRDFLCSVDVTSIITLKR